MATNIHILLPLELASSPYALARGEGIAASAVAGGDGGGGGTAIDGGFDPVTGCAAPAAGCHTTVASASVGNTRSNGCATREGTGAVGLVTGGATDGCVITFGCPVTTPAVDIAAAAPATFDRSTRAYVVRGSIGSGSFHCKPSRSSSTD